MPPCSSKVGRCSCLSASRRSCASALTSRPHSSAFVRSSKPTSCAASPAPARSSRACRVFRAIQTPRSGVALGARAVRVLPCRPSANAFRRSRRGTHERRRGGGFRRARVDFHADERARPSPPAHRRHRCVACVDRRSDLPTAQRARPSPDIEQSKSFASRSRIAGSTIRPMASRHSRLSSPMPSNRRRSAAIALRRGISPRLTALPLDSAANCEPPRNSGRRIFAFFSICSRNVATLRAVSFLHPSCRSKRAARGRASGSPPRSHAHRVLVREALVSQSAPCTAEGCSLTRAQRPRAPARPHSGRNANRYEHPSGPRSRCKASNRA